ncbi:pirin family protein [Alteromonas sp. a30]|uniref:pirin family protein n=1 Tax=Alteromonas sp. a30 TaxID=2730917 RepID=UPI00227E97BD|nr:pirin family protein [Alteromonas sp. a30]MCY7295594.1 pirin family protein [Alteromonas sp. a30]
MKVLNMVRSQPTQDGAGVKIARVADFSGQHLDPYLMIDELKSENASDYMAGFPPHPHRGIETFTYIIKGGFEHQDQMGNKKAITAGHVQWMSTGFGVVHSEMPIADKTDGMHGFQIWLNMPKKDKLRPARYQDSTDTGLPVIENSTGAKLRALAGQWHFAENPQFGALSPLNELTAGGAIADVTLAENSNAELDVSTHEQAFIYVHSGEINGIQAGHLIVLDSQSKVELSSEKGGGALILLGNRIDEEIAHMGPFVMNTQEELHQAVKDYQEGKFGAI